MKDALRRLASLIAFPEQMEEVPRDEIPALLAALEGVRARLWLRTMHPPSPARSEEPAKAEDRLLTAKEAAERLGVTPKWLYARSDRLPFATRLGERTLRFSEQGLIRWMESRKAS